jgi:hypothetical protein
MTILMSGICLATISFAENANGRMTAIGIAPHTKMECSFAMIATNRDQNPNTMTTLAIAMIVVRRMVNDSRQDGLGAA